MFKKKTGKRGGDVFFFISFLFFFLRRLFQDKPEIWQIKQSISSCRCIGDVYRSLHYQSPPGRSIKNDQAENHGAADSGEF